MLRGGLAARWAEGAHCLKTTEERRSAWVFLSAARRALRQGDALRRLSELIAQIRVDGDVEQFMAELTRADWREIGQRQAAEARQRKRRLIIAFVCLALVVPSGLVASYAWEPISDSVAQVVHGTYTPTAPPIEITATPVPTQPAPTVIIVPTEAPVPTARATAIPVSSRLIPAGTVLVPAADAERSGRQWLLLNDVQSGDAWKDAEGAAAGGTAGAYFYTELGNAIVTWNMDVPLNAGDYELLVLDTLLNSVGAQEYEIVLDGVPAAAGAGSSRVIFGGAAAYPQTAAHWLSLGIYRVKQGQLIAVRTTLGARSAADPFAAGPILMGQLSARELERIATLNAQGVVASVLDDTRAAFYPIGSGAQPLGADLQGARQTDPLAWNGGFRTLDLSGDKWLPGLIGRTIRADWVAAGRLGSGKYALYARIPQLKANAAVRYDLIADGQIIDNGADNVIEQGELNGQWARVGDWFLPREAALGVRMTIVLAENTLQCEIGLDAVVLLRLPD